MRPGQGARVKPAETRKTMPHGSGLESIILRVTRPHFLRMAMRSGLTPGEQRALVGEFDRLKGLQ